MIVQTRKMLAEQRQRAAIARQHHVVSGTQMTDYKRQAA